MATKIDISQLQSTIDKYLTEYDKATQEAAQKASEDVAKAAVKDLRKGGSYNTHATGDKFNRGWKVKKEEKRLGTSYTVYNGAVPGLAHLLEFGHAKRNGGRTKAFNFIAPVADSLENKFDQAFKKIMEG